MLQNFFASVLLLLTAVVNVSLEQNLATSSAKDRINPSVVHNGTNNSPSFVTPGSSNTNSHAPNLNDNNEKFHPLGPKVRCDYLPLDFLDCERLVDHNGNYTAKNKTGYGCVKVTFLGSMCNFFITVIFCLKSNPNFEQTLVS